MQALRPLVASDIAHVDGWFEDPETQRWLGGPGWVAAGLALLGPDRRMFVALDDDTPVAVVDVETYPGDRASFAVAVSPLHRRTGVGRDVLADLIAHTDYVHIAEWFAGIETGNAASVALLQRLGFTRVAYSSDGFDYFVRRAKGLAPASWKPPA